MLKFRKGSAVPFPEKIFNEYQIGADRIIANIDADKIEGLLLDFITMHNEPLFFILEIPSKLEDESIEKPCWVEGLHIDVFYIDCCTQEKAAAIVKRIGKLLVNDGLASFGFGCNFSHNEIMIGKYNVVTIFSKELEKYIALLEGNDLKRVDQLVTAWSTFTSDTPGESRRVETDGNDVFDIPEMFAEWGMYFAEQREG